MSAQAVTRRWRRISELVHACRALAGPRRDAKSKIKIQNSRIDERPQTSAEQTSGNSDEKMTG